ncbi:MAG: Hydroxyneurosporene synthase (CrtC) [Syntrophorhabdaceae bacterium PtaU1.Bin034]|nr:MAG: Hydroxyneurosporene synthase (CrtC) [Syntrophorhabdaceae bacterium PtaU1.Bin034]
MIKLQSRISRSLFCGLCFAVVWICLLLVAGPSGGDEWEQATSSSRSWRFPRDHGSHPGYRTEWWYFTGNMADAKGNRYGYQLTFFRQGMRNRNPDPGNAWSVRDLYLAHFAITDVAKKRFFTEERASRTGPGLAGASTERLEVRLLDWQARQEKDTIFLSAGSDAMGLSLRLKPSKPPVMHGTNGLSRKGPQEGQASYYVSYTSLATTGSLKVPETPDPIQVKGVSWFDHEFGSNQLTRDQAGWDWFSLHLSDGKDLMIYLLRRTDGTVEPASSGTIVDRQGTSRHVTLSHIQLEVLDHWKSPRSNASYPTKWRIRVPSEGLDLLISPLLADQELTTEGSTGVTYWEGAVEGRGTSGGQKVTCEGYVEMTGYAGKLGGLF